MCVCVCVCVCVSFDSGRKGAGGGEEGWVAVKWMEVSGWGKNAWIGVWSRGVGVWKLVIKDMALADLNERKERRYCNCFDLPVLGAILSCGWDSTLQILQTSILYMKQAALYTQYVDINTDITHHPPIPTQLTSFRKPSMP